MPHAAQISSSTAPLAGRPSAIGKLRVSAMQVRALCDALAAKGVRDTELLDACEIDPARLSDPYAWFDLVELDQLMVTGAALAKDPAFGLHWGERSSLLQYELVSALQAHAPTLGAAIACILQFHTILAERQEAQLTVRNEIARLALDPLGVSERGKQIRAELGVTAFCRLLEGEGSAIQRIAFAYPRPEHGAEYDRIFGARVHFGQSFTGIEFAKRELDRTRTHRNAELHDELRAQVDRLTTRLRGAFTCSQLVKQCVRAALPRLPTMAEAASTLATSERSLRRRLTEEQSSFSDLVDEVQRERTEELLASGPSAGETARGGGGLQQRERLSSGLPTLDWQDALTRASAPSCQPLSVRFAPAWGPSHLQP